MENCCPCGRLTSQKFVETLQAEAGKKCEESFPGEEGVAEAMWDELNAAPFPTPLRWWRGGGRENQEISCTQEEVSFKRKLSLRFVFISNFPYLI